MFSSVFATGRSLRLPRLRRTYLRFDGIACALIGLLVLCTSAYAQPTSAPSGSAKSKRKDTLQTRTSEVVVNATRVNSLEPLPVTFNEYDREALHERQTVYDVPQLINDMPSTVFYSDNGNGIGYSYLTMRGFDQRRIAVLINGIPQNDPEDHNVYWIDFPDLSSTLDNIQVQRGAGLISYGTPAIGGSINLSTVNITQRRFARVTLGAGLQEHQATGINLAPDDISTWATSKKAVEVGTGLDSHNNAFYARISEIQSRGYRDYSWTKLQSFFVSAGKFEDQYSVQVNVFGGPISDGLAYTGMPKAFINDPVLRRSNDNYWEYDSTGATVGYRAARRAHETESFSQPHVELITSYAPSENLQFSSTLFLYTGRGFFDYDGSWADAATLRLTKQYGGPDSVANPGNAMIRAWVSNQQVGWIPQMLYRHDGGDLLVGLELRAHNSEHWGNIAYAENLPTGFDQDFKIYSYEGHRRIASVFAREFVRLGGGFKLNLEAQFSNSSYAIDNEKAGLVYTSYTRTDGSVVGNGAQIFDVTYNFFNPRVGLTWAIDNQQSAYLSVAQTKREPRMANLYAAEESFYSGSGPLFASDTVNGRQRYNFSSALIKPESMLDCELGWKLRSTDLQAAATLYFMDFKDELVSNGARDIFGNPITGNAPHTRHMGLEAQVDYTLWSQNQSALSIGGNCTISRNRILDYSYQLGASSVSLADNPISGFPDFLAAIYLNLRMDQLNLRLSCKHVGAMYSDSFGDKLLSFRSIAGSGIDYIDNRIDASTVFNLSAAYGWNNTLGLQRLALRMQVNNLLNTFYAAGANGKEFFPAAERNWYVSIEIEP